MDAEWVISASIASGQSMLGDDTGKWLLIALGGLTIAYTLFRPAFRKKDPLDKRQPLFGSNLARQRQVESQMNLLLVELSAMARQISAQLDTRAAKLEQLIHEADEKIAELKALTANADGRPAFRPPMRLARTDPEPDERHAEIYRLADDGRCAQDIAQATDRPKGEVELILALRARS